MTRTCSFTRTRCELSSNDLKEIYKEDFASQMNNGFGRSAIGNLVG